MLGDGGAFELRDVAALYLHAEDLPSAMTHLNAYAASAAAKGRVILLLHPTRNPSCKALRRDQAQCKWQSWGNYHPQRLIQSIAMVCTPGLNAGDFLGALRAVYVYAQLRQHAQCF